MISCETGPLAGIQFADLASLLATQRVLRKVCAHRNTATSTGKTKRGPWQRVRCLDCGDCLSLEYPVKVAAKA